MTWGQAEPHGVLSVLLLLSSVLPLSVPQVDEAQRRMDAEIWQLLSSFAAHPQAPPQGLSPHPQPAAALQAALLSPSPSPSASLSSSAGSQVCAKAPTKGHPPTPIVFSTLQFFLNQFHKFCHFCTPLGQLFTPVFSFSQSYTNSIMLVLHFYKGGQPTAIFPDFLAARDDHVTHF